MVFDFSAIRVPRQKHYSDSTLMTWNKKELIEYIRMLEHNYDVSIQFNENQAQYIESFCPFFKADRNSSEKPNNSIISKMEQVDKDTNVRSKDEPQTDCTEALTLLWIKNMVTDEEFYRIDARLKCISCKWWNDTIVGGSECVSKECTYQPKDEPQTETEIAKAIVHKMIDDAVIAEDTYPDLRQKMHDAVDEYEPQTDCAWGKL